MIWQTNVIHLVINDNEFEILFIFNCENYRNIDFSVINKDRGNWVKVVIRSNSKTQRRQNIVPNKRNI